MSIKKILLAIGMLAVLCTALCACGGEGAAKEPTLEDMLTKEMEGEVLSTVWKRYGFLQTDITTTTVKKWTNTNIRCGGRSQLRMNMETVIPENSTELSSTTHRLMKSQCPPARLKL